MIKGVTPEVISATYETVQANRSTVRRQVMIKVFSLFMSGFWICLMVLRLWVVEVVQFETIRRCNY